MKLNKWTIGLAAAGVVSLGSVARADDTANSVLTALSSTTLKGYLDTSLQWNIGTGNRNNPPFAFNGGKSDGFNLNLAYLTLEKPLDESEWSSGYRFDVGFGPDVGGDVGIRQAYVALRMPLGNGLDWKVGVFNSIIGYESFESINNPNYTRSWGYTIQPNQHTGVLVSYRFCDLISASAGIANTVQGEINQKAHDETTDNGDHPAESYKTYMGSVAVTAPDNWGFLAGSSLYLGVVNGPTLKGGDAFGQASYYVGVTLATPVTGLRLGGAFDFVDQTRFTETAPHNGEALAGALYASYQATEKLSLHVRGEYFRDKTTRFGEEDTLDLPFKVLTFTATAQYDLWKNVLSRLEFRWDHALNGRWFGGQGDPDDGTEFNSDGTRRNAYMVVANISYKF